VQVRGLIYGGLRVVGDVRLDLQRDEAVLAAGLFVDGREGVAGVLDVVARDLPEDLLRVVLFFSQLP
jgi:hypothetical protein